jgi:hypothetical protein
MSVMIMVVAIIEKPGVLVIGRRSMMMGDDGVRGCRLSVVGCRRRREEAGRQVGMTNSNLY